MSQKWSILERLIRALRLEFGIVSQNDPKRAILRKADSWIDPGEGKDLGMGQDFG